MLLMLFMSTSLYWEICYCKSFTLSVCLCQRVSVSLSTETQKLLLFHSLIELGDFWRDDTPLGVYQMVVLDF